MKDAQERAARPAVRAAVAPAMLVHSVGAPVVGKGTDGIIRSWNPGAEKLYGYRAEEAVGQPISLIVPAGRRDELDAIMERLRRGEETEHLETVRRHKDGHELRVSLTVMPIRAPSGEIVGGAAVTHDVTARARAEEAQRFLAEAGRILLGSLGHAERVAEVVKLAVPQLCDWCTLELVEPDGTSRLAAVAHVDEGKLPLLRRVRQRPPLGLVIGEGDGEPRNLAAMLIAEVVETTLEAAAGGPRELSALRKLAPRSVLVEPLLGNDRVLGALLLARCGGRERFDLSDAQVAEAFAQLVALAIDNATLSAAAQETELAAVQAAVRIHRLQERLRALLDAGIALSSELSLEAVLQQTVEAATALTGARYAALGVIDEGRNGLEQFIHTGIDAETRAALGELPRGHGILGLLIDEARPLRLHDLSEHSASAGFPPNHPPMRSFLGVPILIRGVAWGNLYLTEKSDGGDFDDEDEEIVKLLAGQAAVAIENARLYEAAEQATARTRRLQWATAALSEAATPVDVAEVLVGQGAAAAGADAGFVRLVSRDGKRLELSAAVGFADAFVGAHASLPLDSGFPGADAARDGKARWFESSSAIAAAYPEFAAVAARHGALAVIPLRSASGLLGVIALSFAEARRFTHEERELLVALATLCTQALERAQLYEAEQDARSRAEAAAVRIGRLQSITAALSSATTPGEMADVIITHALAALGADAGIVAVLGGDGRTFTTLGAIDNHGRRVAVWPTFPADARLPLPDAVRSGEVVAVESLEERYRRYPEIGDVKRFSSDGALLALPLRIEGRVLGGLGLSFAEARRFDRAELGYIETVADQCAQALERARLYEEELEARRIAEEAREQYRLLLGALDAERRSLGQLIERLHEGVIAVRPDGTIAFSNARAGVFIEELSKESPLPEEWLGFPLRAFALALFDAAVREEALAGDVAGGHLYALTGLPASDSETALLVINDLSERERREQAAREFVTNAAHELRTPVASIAVAVEALQAGAKEEPARRDEFLDHIERESARLARLARSLLVLARAQADSEQPQRTKLRLRPLLAEILAGLEHKDGVELVLSCPSRLAVESNRELLEHAILNLAVNALHYTVRGTVEVFARARPGGGATIEVRDTGPGISPEQQQRVFERFYRTEPGGSGGFGLGLAITRQTVEALGGRVHLESTPEVGSTFRLELPAPGGGCG